MEWVLRIPQIKCTCNLGFAHEDGYHQNDNCNAALETLLNNILTKDKYLRTYHRSNRYGYNIKKDLIPLLINARNKTTIELLVKILLNLTIPVDCLLSVELLSQTDIGRHYVFGINNLLIATKAAFTDYRTTRVIIDFLKTNIYNQHKTKLSVEQCVNISNCLILLRNILHIPEDGRRGGQSPSDNGSNHSVKNQILWNIFSQSIDKVLIKLMEMPDASHWAVTMVELIALLYSNQHTDTLHKFLNVWTLSKSSEDNERNTSASDRGSEVSSSDTGGCGKSNDEPNSVNDRMEFTASMNNTSENGYQPHQQTTAAEHKVEEKSDLVDYNTESQKSDNDKNSGTEFKPPTEDSAKSQSDLKNEKIPVTSVTSDWGYGIPIECSESISTSSNEDELPTKKPVHRKPHNPKQRLNNKPACVKLQNRKRKKNMKRRKANFIYVQGLSHKTPTDDDISSIMGRFTVDFLLKGYNSLVQTVHDQILTNMQLKMDTSHFVWLVAFFLKFATQIELGLEHVCFVLSYDIVFYLTAEGVNLGEQLKLAIKLEGNDLKPIIRRLHLVVTGIREFIQTIEVYKMFGHMCIDDQDILLNLQIKISETEELRSLLVLLLRHYDPKYYSKQYLQDLIVTNHILLMFLDSIMKLPEYSDNTNMHDHLRQLATPDIMLQYGTLLEDYASNGEFVNDCIFTLMHHVGGDLGSLNTLFQTNILKTFTSIRKSEFEICEDWSDLIECVINTFIKKPGTLQSNTNFRLNTESFDDDKVFDKPLAALVNTTNQNVDDKKPSSTSLGASNDKRMKNEYSGGIICCVLFPVLFTSVTWVTLSTFSECETASVTSDFTRMNMSDEEEKAMLPRPVVIDANLLDDRFSSDSENAIAEKRPRVQF